MGDVMRAIQDAIRDVDPALGDRFLVPVKPSDRVIGRLNDQGRRIVALMTPAYEQHGRHWLKHMELRSDPAMASNPALDEWVLESRAIRIRISLLKALFRAVLVDQFPDCLQHEEVIVREGFTLVYTDTRNPEEDLVAKGIGEIFWKPFELE